MSLAFLFLLVAVIFFLISAAGIPVIFGRINTQSAGLVFLAAASLVGAIDVAV